jgi:hypothetical protein
VPTPTCNVPIIDAGNVVLDDTPFNWHCGLPPDRMYSCMASALLAKKEDQHNLSANLDRVRELAASAGMHAVTAPRVAILGAGMCGLMVAHELEKLGCSQYTIFDRRTQLGGLWQDLRPSVLLTSRARFLPLERYGNRYSGERGERVSVGWFAAFWRHMRLTGRVRLGVGVQHVEKAAGGLLRVTCSDGSVELFTHVVQATGAHSGPDPLRINFRNVVVGGRDPLPQAVDAGRVLVIGMGNTGLEELVALGDYRHLHVSARSCPVIVPLQTLGGLVLIEQFNWFYNALPPWFLDVLVRCTSWSFRTSVRTLFPPHIPSKDPGATGTAIALNFPGISHALRRATIHGPVVASGPDWVDFDDGSRLYPDLVVLCTGSGPSTSLLPLPSSPNIHRCGLDRTYGIPMVGFSNEARSIAASVVNKTKD